MSYPVNTTTENDFSIQPGKQFDVKKYVYKFIGLLPWFILSIALAWLGAKIYLRYTMPVNHISAYLLIKDMDEGGNSEYKALKEMGLVGGNKDVQNEIDILKSYSLMRKVVDSLNLNITLYKEGRVTASPIFGEDLPVRIHVVEENKFPDPKNESYRLQLNGNRFNLINGAGQIRTYGENDVIEVGIGKIKLSRNPNIKADPIGYRLIFNEEESVAKGVRGEIDVRQTHDMGGIFGDFDERSNSGKSYFNY